MTADDTPHRAAGSDYDKLPERYITMNQLVAYNVAYWRRSGTQTQEKLREYLSSFGGISWSKAALSAAERSWDGKRVRQFDADEILALSQALGVPLSAMFLPPDDDGVKVRYVIGPAGGEEDRSREARAYGRPVSCERLLERVLPRVPEKPDRVDEAYLDRVRTTADYYRGDGDPLGATRWLDREDQETYEAVRRLGGHRAAVRSLLGDLDRAYEQAQQLDIEEERVRQDESERDEQTRDRGKL
jgi:hypothetical protein